MLMLKRGVVADADHVHAGVGERLDALEVLRHLGFEGRFLVRQRGNGEDGVGLVVQDVLRRWPC